MKIINEKYLRNSIKIDILENKKIGILLKRDMALISSIYSCYRNNITYIPLDPKWPAERINDIVSENGINVVITNEEYKYIVNCSNVIVIDQKVAVTFTKKFIENDISYILYTSGSTGKPKGVAIRRESLRNFIEAITSIIDFSKSKTIACLTAASFDIFFLESVLALEKKMTIILADENEQANPKMISKLISENNVNMVQMTPSKMQLLINYDKELLCLKKVSEVMIGGEPFPINMLHILQKKTNAKIYNMYGPTETTIWSTVSDLTCKDKIDIGQPIKNTEVFIVDENLSILPNGNVGEICIAGKGLAKCYIGRNELTSEKFPFLPQKPDIRVYRTGDFGKYRYNGTLEYIGRLDNQVKIRGHRIELEDIEQKINEFPGVIQSVVVALQRSELDKDLFAFFTSYDQIDQNDLLEFLSKKVPQYMIPVVFNRIEFFFETSNGKLDRNRVFECNIIKESLDDSQKIEKLSARQERFYQAIASNLDPQIVIHLNLETELTALGVNSLTFIEIVVALEKEFDFEFDDDKLSANAFSTIKSMIDYLDIKIP